MSALRLSRPGQPVVLIDQGPSVARKTMTRYGIRGGGTMVTGKPPLTPEQREAQRAKDRAYYAAAHVSDDGRKNPDNGGVQAPITEVHP